MAKCKLIRSSIPAEITVENGHLAWTNPNPNTTFANQQITLNTDGNYSRIKVKCKIFYSDTSFFWREFKKGDNNYIEVDDLNNLRCARRALNYVSDNKWLFGSGVIRDMYNSSGQAADDGRYVIPIEIYTYNDTLTAKVTAVASSVKTNAQNCMLSDGVTDVDTAINNSGYTVTANSSLGLITYSHIAKLNNKLLVDVIFASTANSTSGQEIFAIKKNNQAISCNTGFVVGQRLQNDGNSAYCPVTASGVISAGPSYPIASGKVYHFNFILGLT